MIKKGVYAASLSVLNEDKTLNINFTISHAVDAIKNGLHGVFFFGSTGQSQLISIAEKKEFISKIATHKMRKQFFLGTGNNSLNENIDLIKYAMEYDFRDFLIMPPAYYKGNTDEGVFDFYSRIIKSSPKIKIILYNFEKLSGYVFSLECIEKLVSKFPKQIIGVKDSSYNLYKKLKIDNFSVMPGSEIKLLEGLSIGCSGVITATANVTASLARSVYDDFSNKKDQTQNQKLCEVRRTFDKFNLISGLHTLMAQKNSVYENLLPPLKLLDEAEKNNLLANLKKLNFNMEILKAA